MLNTLALYGVCARLYVRVCMMCVRVRVEVRRRGCD